MVSKSILVVDDDYAIREVMRQVLEFAGYRVITASNGKEGVETLRKCEPPGVVLLDLMMPDMDGYEFLAAKSLDQKIADVPVVVLSASGHEKCPEGAREYFQKPVELDDLLEVARLFCCDEKCA